jgi:hypothetical protein
VRCLPGEFSFKSKKELVLTDEQQNLLNAKIRGELYFLPITMEPNL